MTVDDALIQTRVPAKVAKQLMALAKKEGISVAALVRRTLMSEAVVSKRMPPVTRAWTLLASQVPKEVRNVQSAEEYYRLVGIGGSPTQRTFHILAKTPQNPLDEWRRMSADDLRYRQAGWWFDRAGWRFVLAGDSIWRIEAVVECDRGDGPAVELTLSQEQA